MTPLVIGVGHRDRCDDAVGPLVADAVRRHRPQYDVVTVTTPVRLVDTWIDRDQVVIVDAVRTGQLVGNITVDEVGEGRIAARSGAGGSHGFGVGDAIELGRALGRLPRRVVLVGIEAADFAPGTRLTDEVAAAVESATEAVLDLVTRITTEAPADVH
jgi:hydrogenase maturation protease